MRTASKLFNIYLKEDREYLLDQDAISPEEEGFMDGYTA